MSYTICESSLQNKQVKKELLLKCKPLNAYFKTHVALKKKRFQIKIIGMIFLVLFVMIPRY
jgi:hypothetical protein